MTQKIISLAIILTFVFLSCSDLRKKMDESQLIEAKIDSILVLMTLEEKIGQLQQLQIKKNMHDSVCDLVRQGKVGSFLNPGNLETRNRLQKIAIGESRLGIPLIFGRDVIHGYRTVFPIPLGQAASWNPELVRKAARIAAMEASSEGIDWTFAPMIDISRDPRWGRVAEGCGEDPYLTGIYAKAMVHGFQGNDLKDPSAIASCGKHFAGYGDAEGGKDYNTTLIPESELRNIYLPPFKALVGAGGQTIMSAFNDLNGIPASGNEFTLRRILRNEWNFDGFVISDWDAIIEMIMHGFCKDGSEAALKAIKAGVDMEMVSTSYMNNLAGLVNNGELNTGLIDDAVKNILRVKYRLGLFDRPIAEVPCENVILTADNLELARRLATESCVLLKNSNQVLPVKEPVNRIAIIGPLADAPREQLGAWSPDGRPEESQTPLAAFQALKDNRKYLYAPGLQSSRDKSTRGFAEALKVAGSSQIIFLFLGEEAILSGENHSRAFLNLPGAQEQLIDLLASTGKPLVGIILAGRPLILSDIEDKLDAILYAWHPGTMAGPAIADLLLGKSVPSGKLTISFPRAEGQIPVYYNHRNTGRPPSEVHQGMIPGDPVNPVGHAAFYLDLDYRPMYPFGYGLSYTTFEYSGLKLSADTISMDDTLRVEITVKNSGLYEAFETTQLYIRDLYASLTRPVRELKGFQKFGLEPGESRKVVFRLTAADLAFYNYKGELLVESGDFRVFVGKSSADVLEAGFYLK
ncbi:MAG: beta-glucosidase BglX [Bacteroidales bacterium]|nr:beta-glucosidase BglX [Bacteroidales bacterium]